jgi:integrase
MPKLVQSIIDRLVLDPDEPERFVWDTEVKGFGIRLRRGAGKNTRADNSTRKDARGRPGPTLKRFIVQYRTAENGQRRLTLGDAHTIRCVQAREKARQILARVRLGEDPQSDRVKARRVTTFAVRAKEYLAENSHKWRPSTTNAVERQLLKHAKPLHSQPIGQVSRSEVAALLARISRERGPVIANRTRVALSGLFAWCMVRHELGANPVIGIKANSEQSRERVLNDVELAAIWNSTGDNSSFSKIVRLLMLTGSRRNEIGDMRWSEIDGDVFTLPASRSKNKKPHEVWLCPLAVAQLPPRNAERDVIFGRSAAGFNAWHSSKQRLDTKIERSGLRIPDWTLHDLRRSVATWLSENGTEPHVVEAVLGHVGAKKGIGGVYNKANYSRPKRQALARWAEHVASVGGVDTANVVVLGQLGQRA